MAVSYGLVRLLFGFQAALTAVIKKNDATTAGCVYINPTNDYQTKLE